VDTADLVDQIASELRPEHEDRATWLLQCAADLRSGDELKRARAEEALRGVVHGIGGLLDLEVLPVRRRRLDLLVEELWSRVAPPS
jgi:hypothetical protein